MAALSTAASLVLFDASTFRLFGLIVGILWPCRPAGHLTRPQNRLTIFRKWSSVVLLGYPRPSLAGIGVPWVLTRTQRCALMPRVASRQSANPFVAGVVLKFCCHGRVVVNILSDVGTENTHRKLNRSAQLTKKFSGGRQMNKKLSAWLERVVRCEVHLSSARVCACWFGVDM